MVKQGPFLVELVRADTRQPFAEHTSEDGTKTYAEVEPEVQYFIRVEHTHVQHKIIRADFWLDGEKLDYCTNLIRGKAELHGLWSIRGGRQENKALCFQILGSKKSASNKSPTNKKDFHPWIGSVEVTFSEAKPSGVRRTRNYESQWEGASVDGSISQSVRKVVKSKEGELALMSKNPRKKQRFDAGEHFTSVKVNYCTAFGLVQSGALPKPPLWDYHRNQHPRELFSPPSKRTPSWVRCLNVQPKTTIMTPADPEKGIEEVQAALFDLVEADTSDVEKADDEHSSASMLGSTPDDETRRQGANRKLDFAPRSSKRQTRSSNAQN